MTGHDQIQNYLDELSRHLKKVSPDTRDEIVREISSHIHDSLTEPGATLGTILARLGSPQQVASGYCDRILMKRASRSYSPFTVLRAALRLATRGLFGVVIFLCAVFGYLLGGGLVLLGFLKPIFPANTGLWIGGPGSPNSGLLFPAPTAPAHEVLGIYFTPLALFLGCLLILLTTLIIRFVLRTSRQWEVQLAPPQQRAVSAG